jgi:opacity protein-like surface antigen
LTIALLIGLVSSNAWAQSNTYLSGYIGPMIRPDTETTVTGIGAGTFDLDYDLGILLGGSVGANLDNNFRVEGEVAYRGSTTDDRRYFLPGAELSVGALSLMGNGFFDLDLNSPISPYIGIGAGFAFIRGTAENIFGSDDDDSDVVFAYQLMAGVSYELSPRADLFAGYRFFNTTDYDVSTFGTNFESNFLSHEFMVGARFSF